VLEVLADDQARLILAETNASPQSADDLVGVCEGCSSAVYRRVQVLQEYNLLSAKIEIRPHGDNYRRYTTDFSTLDIELVDSGVRVRTEVEEYVERWTDDGVTEAG
jgi:hypothetical protein